jgi:hypothetical protein
VYVCVCVCVSKRARARERGRGRDRRSHLWTWKAIDFIIILRRDERNAPCCQTQYNYSKTLIHFGSFHRRDRKVEKLLRQADTHGAEMTITIEVIVPGGTLPSNLCVQGPTLSGLMLIASLPHIYIGPDEGEAHQVLPAYAAGERTFAGKAAICSALV